MTDESMLKKAEQRADEKIGFYKHLGGFVVGNLCLFLLNAITSFGEWWFYWITVLWAIGLIVHFSRVFIFTGRIEDNRDAMIEKELERMKK